MTETTLYGIYSCILDSPRIHQVLTCKDEAYEKLLEYVYLLTKLEESKFTQDDLKNENVVLTYQVLENKKVEIIEHTKIEKIEKGWVWNGKKSEIQDKKIGYFNVLDVENQFHYCDTGSNLVSQNSELTPKTPDNVELEINQLIDQMVDSICNMKFEDLVDDASEEDNQVNSTTNGKSVVLNPSIPDLTDIWTIKKPKLDNEIKKYSFENMFEPFMEEIKNTKEDNNNNIETIDQLSPLPISRLSARGQKSKRRHPYSSTRYGNRFY